MHNKCKRCKRKEVSEMKHTDKSFEKLTSVYSQAMEKGGAQKAAAVASVAGVFMIAGKMCKGEKRDTLEWASANLSKESRGTLQEAIVCLQAVKTNDPIEKLVASNGIKFIQNVISQKI